MYLILKFQNEIILAHKETDENYGTLSNQVVLKPAQISTSTPNQS